jgi:hypothetical protein
MSFIEIGLHAQNMMNIPCYVANMMGGGGLLYDHVMSTRFFILTMSYGFVRVMKTMGEVAMASIWMCSSSCTYNHVFCIIGEVDLGPLRTLRT